MAKEHLDNDSQANPPLTDEEQQSVVDQFEAFRSRSQQAYDESVRTIAAAGVAVTASLTAAFEEAGWSGTLAVSFSVASLFANLLSFQTAQADAGKSIQRAWKRDRRGVHESRWRWWTGFFNWAAFFLLLGAGVCLIVFVSSAS